MRRLALLLAVLAASACGNTGDTSSLDLPETETNVTGTFNLSLANGRTVPFDAIVTSAETWTLTADKIVLSADNTWVDSTNYVIYNNTFGSSTPHATATAGTWAIESGAINFVMTSGGNVSFVGSVVANNLAVNFNGVRYVYTR